MRLTIAILTCLLAHAAFGSTNDLDALQFGGVGLLLCSETNGVKVVRVVVDSTSEKAGLLPGDVITKIDGQDIAELPLRDACMLLRGPTGSVVSVSFTATSDQKPKTAKLTRQAIDTATVKWREGTVIVYPDGTRKYIKETEDVQQDKSSVRGKPRR